MNTIKTFVLGGIIIGMVSCTGTNKSQLVGAYSKSSKLTAKDDSIFGVAVLSHSDLLLKPLKVSRQVVAGTNYHFDCIDNNNKHVEVVVYEPLSTQEEARILNIDGKEYTK